MKRKEALASFSLCILSRNAKFKMKNGTIKAFVEKIVVFSPTEIEGHMTFRDELESLRKYLTYYETRAEIAKEA